LKLLVDRDTARRLILLSEAQYADLRRYYVAEPWLRFVLATRNGLALDDLAGRIVDAGVSWVEGGPSLCHEHHVGRQMIRITVYRLAAGGTGRGRNRATTLSEVMAGAPQDRREDREPKPESDNQGAAQGRERQRSRELNRLPVARQRRTPGSRQGKS
jgi:hypothetical protein